VFKQEEQGKTVIRQPETGDAVQTQSWTTDENGSFQRLLAEAGAAFPVIRQNRVLNRQNRGFIQR
jgi:hypothetical protein